MRLLHLSLSFALQTSLCSIALGYTIDSSCDTEEIRHLIHDAMKSAIDMADAAFNRLTENPLKTSTLDVVAKLFARPGQCAGTAINIKTIDVFSGIRTDYRDERPPSPRDAVSPRADTQQKMH